nr:hypothetical protein [bacterium]
MRNPLSKRFPRELKHNLGKYLGIFLMMVFATSFTSSFLLAASSIETILDDMDETYNVEDGRFVCDFEADDEAIDAVEALGVTVYKDFYRQVPLELVASEDAAAEDVGEAADDDILVRVYSNRTEVNLAAYAEGVEPTKEGEIALDRVFMDNHDLSLGDTVIVDGHECTIVGIMTLPDYQALFQSNTDFIFDSIGFSVAQVAPEEYKRLDSTAETFNYSFIFDDKSLDLASRSDIEDDMIDALVDNDASISDFIDAEDNQAIGYAHDDVSHDQTMWTVLLFMLVVIMAFVFVVLTGATIEQESSVIGTLLASGWRKGELVRHYLVLPAIVGILAVVIGLVVGIVFFTDSMRALYYNSYSIPPYHTIWNWRIVFNTAVLPYILLVGITLLGLMRKMRFTPLQFLRHEVSGRKRGARIRLPERLSYPARFRMRLLMRNASHFITLFCGIMFASLLLLFGICMLPVVDNYAGQLRATVASPYQYALKAPLELDGTDEERDMYAAALRLVEDRDRIEANRDAIEAAERLQDDEALMDALERLKNNKGLLDALDRLQSQQALMDAAERLQYKQGIIAAAQRLQSQQAVVDAAQRLQGKHDVVAAAQRLSGQQGVIDAATRLQDKPDIIAAAQRLQGKQDAVAAAQRLQGKEDIIAAAQRLQERPEVIAAAQHAAEGTATEEELALLESLDEQTASDLQVVMNLDAQTRVDIQTVAGMDAQTRADIEMMASLDAQTKSDLQTLQGASSQTLADIETVSKMDAQTRKDLETLQNASAQTQKDLETVANMDAQTKADFQLVQNASAQTRADMELVSNVDAQTRKDLELISNLDAKKRADLDLVRSMDSDLLDDLLLAGDIDEDAHPVNSRDNGSRIILQTEKFAMASVEVHRVWGDTFETITVYGIKPDSRYWKDIPVSDGQAIAGMGLIEKTDAEVGSDMRLFNHYEGEEYTVAIAGEASNESDTALYMTLDDFNRMFGNDADFFNAYASGEELMLDGRYVAKTIRPSDMDKISAQMRESMGDIMFMILLMSIPIYLIIVYLLTKTVIDRSARSISYMKVFGYRNNEVNGLYVRPITFAVLFSLVVSIPLIVMMFAFLVKVIFMTYAGNFPLIIP